MRFFLLSIITAFALLGLYLYSYLGFYRSAQILGTAHRDFYFLYKEHVGPYHQINGSIEEVEKFAQDKGIACGQTFGRFLDDPGKVDSERLRSEVGCVVSGEMANRSFTPMTIQQLGIALYLHLRFDGSPSIGPMKVYPLAEKWVLENKVQMAGPVIETYQHVGEHFVTDYYFPITK